ncbi:MAG: PD40 domain-containing protein, partial [Pirellulales bacterium]|nr:PD40 domain-containing protein [Pirellulales bacterium]
MIHRVCLILVMMSHISVNKSASETEPPTQAPFGAWRSPIAAAHLVQGAVRFGDVISEGSIVYWSEGRPQEGGRYAIVRQQVGGKQEDILPMPLGARSTVHEYGGGAIAVYEGVVYFTNYSDQRLWRLRPGESPSPITAESMLRFADLTIDSRRDRLLAVCEDHSPREEEPANRLVAVRLADGQVTTLAAGADFYSTPRISPDGRSLCWLQWNHPNMPWDGTELYVAPIAADGSLGTPHHVAGGEEESIFQPSWSPDGTLYFVSDRTNWWNLYALRADRVNAVLPMEAEFGVPQWVFGASTYGFLADGSIVARYGQRGTWSVMRIDPRTGNHSPLRLPYTHVSGIEVAGQHVFLQASSPTEPESLVVVDTSGKHLEVLRRSSSTLVDL